MSYKWKDNKKAYHKIYHKKWYQQNKKKVQERTKRSHLEKRIWWNKYKLQLKCIQCGENHPSTIDFHHKNPQTKEKGVSELISCCASQEKILKEIDKCDVLCSNCHRKIHWEEESSILAGPTIFKKE